MKSYTNNKVLKGSWIKRQSYFLSSDMLGDGSKAGWKLIEIFLIESIKYNPIESNFIINESSVGDDRKLISFRILSHYIRFKFKFERWSTTFEIYLYMG
ncbi:MAG: hypothetical protein KIT33_02660 [Candidatus Kapabacteria bacterium]|nr:hypothetical protein [Ignavibacteriota bacterium]MCW5883851.1 hypothetical protein [Candidatus Kapabacteria bacterium]